MGSRWSITFEEEANVYAEALAGVFRPAIEEVGRKDEGRSMAYLISRQLSNTLTPEKKDFFTVIRKAKREYWRRIRDNAKDDTALYRVISWHKQASRIKAPPLAVNSRLGAVNLPRGSRVLHYNSPTYSN